MTFWIAFSILAVACIHDFRRHEVPDLYSVLMLALGLTAAIFGLEGATWGGFGLGAVVGFALGALLFWKGGMGGADAKMLAALGSVLGPLPLLVFFFYAAVLGGVLSIAAAMRKQTELAYFPAMALGLIVFHLVDGRMPHEYL